MAAPDSSKVAAYIRDSVYGTGTEHDRMAWWGSARSTSTPNKVASETALLGQDLDLAGSGHVTEREERREKREEKRKKKGWCLKVLAL